jgi:hypothetical protein
MKKLILFFAIILLVTSCITYVENNKNFYSENNIPNNGEINLLTESQYKKSNEVLVELKTQSDYQLLVPLSKLTKYVIITDDNKLQLMSRCVDSLIDYSHSHNQRILITPQFSLSDYFNFHVNELDLFKSGEFYIISKKTGLFIDKIYMDDKGFQNTPMTRGHDVWIYIDKLVFWKVHIVTNN